MSVEITAAGVTYDNRQEFLKELAGKLTKCRFVPEPDNQWNTNAIAIYAGELKIGYVRDEICSDLLPCLDDIESAILKVQFSERIRVYCGIITISFKGEE